MRTAVLSVAAGLAFATAAVAQPGMYAIDFNGNLIRLNMTTGAGTLVGNTGFTSCNAAAADSQGRIFTHGSSSDELVLVDQATGVGSVFLNLTGRPFGYGIRGMAFDPQDHLYVALSQASTTTNDLLATIDMTTGVYTSIGTITRPDIQGLAFDDAGHLYGAAIFAGLCTIDPGTGAATLIGGGFGGDDQSLEFANGVLYSCRINLRTVDTTTGATTVVGATGFNDIRGLAFVRGGSAPCYANCDGSTAAPILNVNDFICFQSAFAAGASYANCDHSTTAPVLNVNDFICFQAMFAQGCR